MDGPEARFDQMNLRIDDNHAEVMQALRSLGAAATSSERKRSPEIGGTPLKAIAGGRGQKESKQ